MTICGVALRAEPLNVPSRYASRFNPALPCSWYILLCRVSASVRI